MGEDLVRVVPVIRKGMRIEIDFAEVERMVYSCTRLTKQQSTAMLPLQDLPRVVPPSFQNQHSLCWMTLNLKLKQKYPPFLVN
jgi:hypothetical protein